MERRKAINMFVKPLKQNTIPTHAQDMHTKKRGQWEQEVFDDAVSFRVSLRLGPGKIASVEFDTLPEALNQAWAYIKQNLRPMVYAISSNGRSFCIPPQEWKAYYLKWKAKQNQPCLAVVSDPALHEKLLAATPPVNMKRKSK